MDELESSCDDRLQCGERPCDYDGDGALDPAFYRPTTGFWFGVRANGQTVVLNTNIGFVPGDIPVPADYNGDGKCDPGYMRPGVGLAAAISGIQCPQAVAPCSRFTWA